MTETSLELAPATPRLLLQRGLRLEYVALTWNGMGNALVLVAAAATRSVARFRARQPDRDRRIRRRLELKGGDKRRKRKALLFALAYGKSA